MSAHPMKRRYEGNLGRSSLVEQLATTPALAPPIGTLAREALERSRAALPIITDVAPVEAAAEGR